MVNILPYVEQNALYNNADYANGYAGFLQAQATPIKVYYCPSEPRAYPIINGGAACTDYVAIAGLDYYDGLGIINHNSYYQGAVRVTDITDGTSNTILAGERPPSPSGAALSYGSWADGFFNVLCGVANQNDFIGCGSPPFIFGGGPNNVNINCSVMYLWSNHTGIGANFTMGDGSVRFISYSASAIMPALATRAGGEVASVP